MDVVLLPSSTGPDPAYQFLSTYLFDGVLAVDAGSLGFWGDLAGQARVRHVVLTHSHIDHTASLPIFLENVYGSGPTVNVHASAAVLDGLRSDVFNDRTFPDLISRPPPEGPFVRLRELTPGRRRKLGEHAITAVPLNHIVPTVAVLVESADASVLVVSDTAPSDDVWTAAVKARNLKAVLLEATFPDDLQWLADKSGHLTTTQFAAELAKVPSGARRLAIHLKPWTRDRVRKELAGLRPRGVELMVPGRMYSF
jgi:ribonuclease BN (tRNA processing enzyme)